MSDNSTILAQNIRYLRKQNNLSQEEFASQLGIKRSNIAAYESKNVEPRLRVVLEIAKFFNVSVKSLIDKRIEVHEEVDVYSTVEFDNNIPTKDLDIKDNVDINEFIKKSIRIRKVLEGFKSFYSFKKNKKKCLFYLDSLRV